MPSRLARNTQSITAKTVELAVAVPQVVAHRVARMAMAGPRPSRRDRKEFDLMVAEKNIAFIESWRAMTIRTIRTNQSLAASFGRLFWSPWVRTRPTVGRVAAQLQGAAIGVLGKGLDPVHRRAVANSRRLARTRLR